MTGGGADYSFECVGDTGVATTALQSCSDVCFLVQHLTLSPCFVYTNVFGCQTQFKRGFLTLKPSIKFVLGI